MAEEDGDDEDAAITSDEQLISTRTYQDGREVRTFFVPAEPVEFVIDL